MENEKKYLIVGLGNAEQQYAGTRHNYGFEVANAVANEFKTTFKSDRLAYVARASFKGRELVIIMPTTYMNLSGKAVKYWLAEENVAVDHCLVIYDDIDLPLGIFKMKPKGGGGTHNGIGNIIDASDKLADHNGDVSGARAVLVGRGCCESHIGVLLKVGECDGRLVGSLPAVAPCEGGVVVVTDAGKRSALSGQEVENTGDANREVFIDSEVEDEVTVATSNSVANLESVNFALVVGVLAEYESATRGGVNRGVNGLVDYHVDVQSVLNTLTVRGDEGETIGVDCLIGTDNIATATEGDIATTLDSGVRHGALCRCSDMDGDIEDRVTLAGGSVGNRIFEVGIGGVGGAVPSDTLADGGVNVSTNTILVDGEVKRMELGTDARLSVSLNGIYKNGVGCEGVATPCESLADDSVERGATRILEGEGERDNAVATEAVGEGMLIGAVGGVGLASPFIFAASGDADIVVGVVVYFEVKNIEGVVAHQEGNGISGVCDTINPSEALASDLGLDFVIGCGFCLGAGNHGEHESHYGQNK